VVTCEAQSRPGAIDSSSGGRDLVRRPPLSERPAHPDARTRRLRNPQDGIQSYLSPLPRHLAAAVTCEALYRRWKSSRRASGLGAGSVGRTWPAPSTRARPSSPDSTYSGLLPHSFGPGAMCPRPTRDGSQWRTSALGLAPVWRHARRGPTPGPSYPAGGLGSGPGAVVLQ
jgi:hypothetical protein